mmetsp:Transcript_15041/g.36104  ORF Transcript_15041/g.36104 Transcript_15041/m.36104 type:complete len:678 (-) Transcript_15041:325-2358(-)
MGLSSKCSKQCTLSCLGDLHINDISIQSEPVNIWGNTLDVEAVLGIHVGHLGVERVDSGDITCRNLSLAEGFHDLLSHSLDMFECLEYGSAHNDKMGRHLDRDSLLLDQTIEPGGINGVRLEVLSLQQLYKVLDRVANVSTDLHALQRQNKGLACRFTVGALCKQVTKLGIGELVNPSVGTNREVSPDIRSGLELDALNAARCRFESFIRVLSSNTRSHDVGVNVHVAFLEEVNRVGTIRIGAAIELSNLRNVVKGDAHSHLELSRREVGTRNALSDRMLNLQPRVQLQEEIFIGISIVQILHGTCTLISNVLRQTLCSQFHLVEGLFWNDGWGSLLKNLLEAPLSRAITAVEGDSITMLISDDLDLDVTRVLTELHDEDGRADNLILNLNVCIAQICLVVNKSDTLSSTSLRGFDHDTVFIANTRRGFNCLLNIASSTLLENFLGDGPLRIQVCLERAVIRPAKGSAPWDGGNLGSLRKDVGGDFISQDRHDRSGGTNELDSQAVECVGKLRILGSVSPSGPHRVHSLLLRNFDNDVDVGVVVQVLSRRNFYVSISQTDEFGIGLEIFGRGHGDELHGAFVPEFHVGPLTHGHDGFRGRHAVVGDEDLADGAVASARLHVVLDGFGIGGRGRRVLERCRPEGAVGLGDVGRTDYIVGLEERTFKCTEGTTLCWSES